jgi:hypothetical protein
MSLRADTTWTNATGNRLWADSLNWNNGVPTSTDTAYLLATGSIMLPSNATAGLVRQSVFAPSSPVQLQAGHLSTNFVDGTFNTGTITIASAVGALTDALNLRDVVVTGTIGDGLGGGMFDVVGMNTELQGASTTHGEAVLGFATLSAGGSVASANRVVFTGNGNINVQNGFAALDRLPDNGTIQLYNPVVSIASSSSAAASDSAGTIALEEGRPVIQFLSSIRTVAINAQSLSQNPGTTFQFFKNGSNALRFATSPTGPNGAAATDRDVLGYGYDFANEGGVFRANFLTYDTGADAGNPLDDPGLRQLTAAEVLGKHRGRRECSIVGREHAKL